MPDIQQESAALGYYRQRQYQPGWQDLVDIMITAIGENAGEQDRRQFLQLIGGELARRFSLPHAATVGELEDQLNQLWARFNWGYIRLRPEPTALVLQHYALPPAPTGTQSDGWIAGLAAILEGAYAQWLLSQGGQQHVMLRWQPEDADDSLTFRYQTRL